MTFAIVPSVSDAVAVRVTGPGDDCVVGETASETLGDTLVAGPTVTPIVAEVPVAPLSSVAIALKL
ncbi:MAG: hypothetical protein IPF73_11780 [Betaproteobacteria bacterium]|nr:hypothetical protein [Betaproteobacteria bacterium]